MSRKEWREVGKHSLYFVLTLAGMALLLGGMELLVAALGLAQARPLEGEKLIIILAAWLLMFSMFLGLSPFAMDSKQKGMEYLLTLPYSRRRLLVIKFLPRLAAVAFFYIVFTLLYRLGGSGALGGFFAFFSISYFALFFISFSFSGVHENFIVQSIWAGLALGGYLTLGSLVMALGFAWSNNFSLGSVWRFGHFGNLIYDLPSLIAAAAVFLLLLAPFVASFFLAFNKFDLRPARVFHRRHLLFFAPLFLLALGGSLGISSLIQQHSAWDSDSRFHLTVDRRVLKIGWQGKASVHDETGRRRIESERDFLWTNILFEKKGEVILLGNDMAADSLAITRLRLDDLSTKMLDRIPERFLVSPLFFAFRQHGNNLVYLRNRSNGSANQSVRPLKSDRLDLVVLDLDSGKSRILSYQSPLFPGYYQPKIFAHDEIDGRRFWLIGNQGFSIIRLWEDGSVENLGISKKMPSYFGHLLFSGTDKTLTIRRLLDGGGEAVKEIGGGFKIAGHSRSLATGQFPEIYAERSKMIVRIDLKSLEVAPVAPCQDGHLRWVAPGDFYYIASGPRRGGEARDWQKVYRLKNGRMIFLKKFAFQEPGQGSVQVEEHGIVYYDRDAPRFFAFPDLKELKFKKLN